MKNRENYESKNESIEITKGIFFPKRGLKKINQKHIEHTHK